MEDPRERKPGELNSPDSVSLNLISPQIRIPRQQIHDFCERHQIAGMWLFGSAVRPDFGPDSDVDVLVSYKPGIRPSLHELTKMESELADIFGRPVDLVERKAVERSPNYIRRKNILGSLEPVHVAG